MSVTTGSGTTTWVLACDGVIPSDGPCDWHEMHHTDDEGRHWCPTGFAFCHTHGGIGTITGPAVCQLWGAPSPTVTREPEDDG